MSEISLKEYFAKLNSRLAANAADEVIHHCRHILQSYPKNVMAYRLLGRALVLNGRWDEGREALRRVLSVIPDDYSAHLGLSEANERMDRADEAIWHLERALEQRPNDKDLIEALRGLYRRYRHVENLKIQLTAVAVARQNLRGGNYAQAIDTLRNALTRMNDRLDLKLLLAQILWQNGSEEESAEIALEVLKVLPDCLEANRIMAKLWLSVDRPSDAQRYVNHLESVDPYLAVELVQGSAPDDDVFRIDELDYVRSAQSEMASDRPDWLQEISVTPTSTGEVAKATMDDDWSSAMLKKPPTGPLKEVTSPPPGQSMSARFAAMRQEEPANSGGMTDLFGKPDDSNAQELSSIFAGDHSDEEDPMAWMRDAGVQIVDDDDDAPQESSYNNLFGDDDDDGPLPEEENPLAWLQGADVTLDDNEPSNANNDDSPSWLYGNTSSEFDETEEPAATASDSLDWLQGDSLDEALGMDSLNVDPTGSTLIQMRSPSVTDRADQLFDGGANEPPAPAPRRGLTSMLQDTNFDWSNTQQDEKPSGDDEMDDWLNQFGPPAEPRKAVTETPDWLTDLEKPDDAASDDDAWFAPDEPESVTEQPVAASEEFAWMSDEKSDNSTASGGDDSDWLAEFSPTDEEAEQPAEDDEFTWMAADSADEEADAEEVPDWLSELNPGAAPAAQPAAEAPVGSALKWLNNSTLSTDDSKPEVEAESEADAMPDWLSELEPDGRSSTEQPTPLAEGSSLDTEFSWLSDDALGALDSAPVADSEFEPEAEASAEASEEIDWMSELEPEGESAAEVVPDWLSELEPEAEADEPEPVSAVSASSDTEFSWLNDDAEPEAEASDSPDWLSELAPEGAVAASAEPAVADDSEFTWMSDEALATPEAEGEAVAVDDLDWLSELEPTSEAEASEVQPVAESAVADDSDFTWMSDEALASPEAEASAEAVSSDVPDWLSELEPELAAREPETEAEPDAVVAQDSEFTWMMEEALSKAEPEGSFEPESEDEDQVVAGDVPDWLSELAPEPSSESEPEAAVVTDSEFTWMTDEALANAESVSETVDPEFVWMVEEPESSSAVEPEPEAEPELETAATGDLDWLSELEPEEASVSEPEAEPQAVAASDLDWMSELEPEAESAEFETEPEAEAEPVAVPADDLSWLSDLEPAQEISEAEPEAEPEVAAAEPVAADELGWLSELEPEADSAPEPEPEAVAAEDTSWLSDLQPEDEPVSEPEPEAVAAESDDSWLSELEPEEEESEFEPEAMATGISGDDLAWLDEENAESEAEPDAEPEAEPEATSIDGEEEVGENEAEYAAASLEDDEVLEPTAAHNAPDWLNAMVPGLDVDYEAEAEEFAEEEPEVEPEPEVETSKREYAWLIEMVEQENAAAAVATEESPRFAFSRPPSWLQTVNGLSHPQGDKVDDDLPDWPSDDADADVPEWLR